MLPAALTLAQSCLKLVAVHRQHGDETGEHSKQLVDVGLAVEDICHISKRQERCIEAYLTVASAHEQLLGIVATCTGQNVVNQDVGVEKYAFHRLRIAFNRGSLSISSWVNLAQPLHFSMSGDTLFTL